MTGYHVLLRRPKEGEETIIVYVSDMGNTAAADTDTGTDLNTMYGYHVKAKNAHGLSEVSNFARIDTWTPLREHRQRHHAPRPRSTPVDATVP